MNTPAPRRFNFSRIEKVKKKSDIRKNRESEAKPFRKQLIANVGQCENCGCSPSNRQDRMPKLAKLDVHEISCGSHRQKSLDKPFAVLVLCWQCNSGPFHDRGQWPESRQLALLAKKRPKDFDLTAYLELTSPRAMRRIEIHAVLEWMEEEYLTKSEIAKKLQVDRRSVQNWIESGELLALDARTVGATKPLYRVAWSDYLAFCKSRIIVH